MAWSKPMIAFSLTMMPALLCPIEIPREPGQGMSQLM